MQPTYGDNSAFRNVYSTVFGPSPPQPSRLAGRYYVGTYEKRPANSADHTLPSGTPAGSVQGDGPTGALTSQPFVIGGTRVRCGGAPPASGLGSGSGEGGGGIVCGGQLMGGGGGSSAVMGDCGVWGLFARHALCLCVCVPRGRPLPPRGSFLIGGGCNERAVYVELLVDGDPTLRASGACAEGMSRVHWDVSLHTGRTGVVRIVDSAGEDLPWGHINVDDFRFDWAMQVCCAAAAQQKLIDHVCIPPPPAPAPAALSVAFVCPCRTAFALRLALECAFASLQAHGRAAA